MSWFRLAIPILLWAILTFPSGALCQQDEYPWVHCFQRPDMPAVHCAFADAKANVIVSTGDWFNGWYDWSSGDYIHQYWSEGMFRIREGEIEEIECPDNTFVLDCAIDSTGRTWVLLAEGHDYREHGEDPPWRARIQEADIGFRWWRFPRGIWSRISDYRLAYVNEGELVEYPEITESIPGQVIIMTGSSDGWVFAVSKETSGNYVEEFLSWWRSDGIASVQVLRLSNRYIRDYPAFGPDGLAYILLSYSEGSTYERGVLGLDPDTGQITTYTKHDSAYLDSATRYSYVDPLNIRWFGTEDGLVRFDGQTWTRWTTENSGLPYNLVRQMLYDEIDGVYYIITQGDQIDGSYPYAFCTLSATGQRIGMPLELSSSEYELYHQSRIFRSAGNVFWLRPYGTGTVYSYDHERIVEWEVGDWLAPYSHVSYIGSTAAGRTFCVNGYRVMIW